MKKNNKAAALDATDPEDQSLSVPWIYVNPFPSSLLLVNPVTGTWCILTNTTSCEQGVPSMNS